MPMAKQAPQIWTEKLGVVHPLPFSGVIFREIGHLTTIPIFWSNQCKRSTNYKTTMGSRDLQNYVILYCDCAIRLTQILFPICTKQRAVTKIPSRQTNATDREQ